MLVRRFEGPVLLDRLLAKAGAQVDCRGAIARFLEAQREGRAASEEIPRLFAKEPRFGGPEDALRFYGNLLGLWDLLEAGGDREALLAVRPPEEEAPPRDEVRPQPEPPPEPPPRGSSTSIELSASLIEAITAHLCALPVRERRRRRDRYENVQSELVAWVGRTEERSDAVREALESLAFELTELFEHAFGDRLGLVRFRALEAADPAEASQLQPHAVGFVARSLESPPRAGGLALDGADRAIVVQLAQATLVALTRAVVDSNA